jgi:hypothetical protein
MESYNIFFNYSLINKYLKASIFAEWIQEIIVIQFVFINALTELSDIANGLNVVTQQLLSE